MTDIIKKCSYFVFCYFCIHIACFHLFISKIIFNIIDLKVYSIVLGNDKSWRVYFFIKRVKKSPKNRLILTFKRGQGNRVPGRSILHYFFHLKWFYEVFYEDFLWSWNFKTVFFQKNLGSALMISIQLEVLSKYWSHTIQEVQETSDQSCNFVPYQQNF